MSDVDDDERRHSGFDLPITRRDRATVRCVRGGVLLGDCSSDFQVQHGRLHRLRRLKITPREWQHMAGCTGGESRNRDGIDGAKA